VKTGCNLAEISKKNYGSKRAVLPMTVMIMIWGTKTETYNSKKNVNTGMSLNCC
jgi:hypothetical protein